MKIDRLMSIIMVLLNCEKISATKLAEMFEVTPRTIYRDIDSLSQAGIPIVTTTGVDGGISIMPAYKVDKKFFSTSDIQALLMGLSSIATTLSQKELVGTIEKVKSLLPKEHAKALLLKSNQITVDLTTWMGNKNFIINIEKIKQALNDSTCLMFDYCGARGEKNSRIIEPYQLILKESHWYLQGYCTMRNNFRVFKLSRISSLEVLDFKFTPREFQPKPLDGNGWIDKRLITIKLLIDATLLEKMTEHCGDHNIQPYGDNQFIVHFPFVPDDMGYNILLGFGDQCECLAPEAVRLELTSRIHKLYKIYNRR